MSKLARREFLKGSRVRQVVYHATTADFIAFNTQLGDLGAHFGSCEQANNVLKNRNCGEGHIMPVLLNIRNPLRLKDVGSFHADGIAVQLERKGLLPKGEGKRIEQAIEKDWRLRKQYDPMLRDLIRNAGHDGIVYANTAPGEGDGDCWIAFEPSQIKSAIGNSGRYDPTSHDITDGAAARAHKKGDAMKRTAPVTPEFQHWFGNSRAVDGEGNPLVLYHGTGSLENLRQFDPALTGNGNDQIGSGFYFTSSPEEASAYTTAIGAYADPNEPKLGGDDSPGVLAVYLSIQKPIVVNGSNLRDTDVNLTAAQAYEIICRAPGVRDIETSPLGNWIDIWSAGGVTEAMLHEVAEHYVGGSLIQLEHDFYDNASPAYREVLRDVLGYDGVVLTFETGKQHWVAWFPSQIKSAIGNSGRFDPASPDLTDGAGQPSAKPAGPRRKP